ncbi:ABC transporter ATP-binding protein [Microbispora cellulosiformans]|uniref:ABC transporter ATP-binding protein n=1 Tax=Microbispora cellulosiformans TaxID=2614688 RepID=A0A5J5K8L2_9ACTN|nr:ABC transporter ATP-binding protein [Microbispora cellulosiformans]KAA9380816.1 ABC transporter ATP-binding protein [Microbispora cellulosiformans]
MTAPVLLAAEEVTKSFGSLLAVDGVSIEVRRGEVFGLAGPNGAGKSTLFNLLTGIPIRPDSGKVIFDGQEVQNRSPRWIAKAGLKRTFQTEAVFESLSVRDNVRVGSAYGGAGRTARWDRARCAEALERVELGGDWDRPADGLSLIDRKRLMIACALVSGPSLLLLDEPAAGLDPADQEALIRLLAGIHATGTTMVIIEHVLSVLEALAGRMAVLDSGRVIVTGAPAEVLTDPRVVEAYLGPGGGR